MLRISVAAKISVNADKPNPNGPASSVSMYRSRIDNLKTSFCRKSGRVGVEHGGVFAGTLQAAKQETSQPKPFAQIKRARDRRIEHFLCRTGYLDATVVHDVRAID